MKFELSLKSTHQDIIQELKNKLSLESEQDIVKKAVESALQMKTNDLIFATEQKNVSVDVLERHPVLKWNLKRMTTKN